MLSDQNNGESLEDQVVQLLSGVQRGSARLRPTASKIIDLISARQEGRQSAGERVKASGECLTPGCVYTIKIEPYARWGNFHRAHVNVRVGLPERVDMAAPSQYEGDGEAAPWGIKQKAYLDAVEEIAHRHMEAAIAEIGAFDLTQGGTFARDWPALLAPPAAPVEQGEAPGCDHCRGMGPELGSSGFICDRCDTDWSVNPPRGPKMYPAGHPAITGDDQAADQKDGAS
ncbi:hypothetical protein [Caulobacter segnis]